MRFLDIQTAVGAAIVLLALPAEAKHDHSINQINILGRRHTHKKARASSRAVVEKRDDGPCAFPTNAGLVPVTMGAKNKGWAMSPDQECVPDSFCPYACPPGQVMAQWNPEAKSYPNPKSMDGGLYCNKEGKISLPLGGSTYCKQGTNTVGAKNECKKKVAFCQTVLPGNEAMIIPTEVDSWAQIAIPGSDYWLSTAAHYYVNFPGYSTAEACIWGDGNKPLGNWSPYVAGGNTAADGTTSSMISWNPIYTGSWHKDTKPDFGIKIECLTGNCLGLPCEIDPSKNGVGGVTSNQVGSGADSVKFCVVTIPPGGKANIVTFPIDGSDSSSVKDTSSSEPSSKADPTTTSATKTPEPTTSAQPTTTSTSTASKSKSKDQSSTTSSDDTSETSTSSSAEASSTSALRPQILFEIAKASSNVTGLAVPTRTAALTSATQEAAAATATEKKSNANAVSGSMFGLAVVFAAAVCIL